MLAHFTKTTLIIKHMQISSLTEIKLLRKTLKKELQYAEERMENETLIIIGGYKSWITYNIIEKGISYSLNFVFRKLFPKRF